MLNNKNYLQYSLEISLYFLPISFLLGTLIVNLNLIIFIFLSTIYLIIKKIKVNFNLSNLILLAFFLTLIFSSYKNIEQIGIENFLKFIFFLSEIKNSPMFSKFLASQLSQSQLSLVESATESVIKYFQKTNEYDLKRLWIHTYMQKS